MKHNWFVSFAVALVLVLSLLGCDLLSTFLAPARSTPSVSGSSSAAATPPGASQATAAPRSAVSTQGNYDGEWSGKSSTDSTISFSVENNQVTDISVNYNGPAGTCRNLSLSFTKSVKDAPIKGKDFIARAEFDSGEVVTLTGAFASNGEASGTVTSKGKFQSCGDYEVKATWKATNSTASTSGANPSTAGAPASVDAVQVLRSFFDAINAKQVDAALAFVDDDVIFNIGSTAVIGKGQLRTYLAGQASRGVTYALSNIQDQGDDTVTFSLKVGAGAATDDNSAILDEGKIQIMTLR